MDLVVSTRQLFLEALMMASLRGQPASRRTRYATASLKSRSLEVPFLNRTQSFLDYSD